ncbi:MAG TPA: T9SS type A sorting domain-containing protein [Tenuifilaceae bacterium]|nr:T9SS type A sorting domain-containing protein [Tenuifilaceae bacterium]
MKKIAFITITVIAFNYSTNAQLKVDNSGNIGVGTITPVEQFQIGDRWTFHNGGSKLIGYNHDYSGTSGKRIFADEASAINLDSYGNILFHVAPYGSAGSTITWKTPLKIQNNGSIFFDLTSDTYQDIYMESGAKIRPSVKSNGSLGTSSCYWYAAYVKYFYRYYEGSLSLKSTNHEDYKLDNAVSILSNLKAVGYIPKEEIKSNENNNGSIGFNGKDVYEVLPQLVVYDTLSNQYGVDYDGLIPVLVEALKEQQKQIDELNRKISELNLLSSSNLFPNPTDYYANIKTSIPSTTKKAVLMIYNSEGKLIKQINIEDRGNSIITFDTSNLMSGIYVCSLIADGNILLSKKMIKE